MQEQFDMKKKKLLIEVLSRNLSTLRAKTGLSQDGLAVRLGLSRQTISSIENGKKSMQWSTFVTIILYFLHDDEIAALMELLEIYTEDVQRHLRLNNNLRRQQGMNILEQRNFSDEVPDIINAGEPHMALVFLLDTSGSMRGEPIRHLNEGLNRFKVEVCDDKQTRNILDVAIIAFNNKHSIVQEFTPIEHMSNVNLAATGGTYMTGAIETALDMVTERSRFYRRSGTEPYKPWVILISDGAPSDNINNVAQKIKKMEEEGKVSFRSLGVEGYNSTILHTLSGPKVMKLVGVDFSSFFDWVNKSMRSISQSSPGEKPKAEKLSGNVVVDTDWD